jgi:Na+/proline symporter
MAGPAPNYDMQRILANKNPKSAALMSGFVSIALFFPRYLMITGITVLALVFYSPQLKAMGNSVDFEQILPYVINNFIPVGLVGFMIAGLLAAFMSTFDSTVNAGAAYIVNDIYKRYINPDASDKKYVIISYASSILIVVVGVAFGFMTKSINSILNWIVAGLYGGYIAPNVLKWHWWRLNGYGYFAGMLIGIIAALIVPVIFPDIIALYRFPLILLLSGAASIITSLLTPLDDEQTLKDFYRNVRPWGFWKPIYKKIKTENPEFNPNKNFPRDTVNIVIGVIWQLSLTLIAIYLVIKDFYAMIVSIILLVITSIFLKFNWYDKLEEN